MKKKIIVMASLVGACINVLADTDQDVIIAGNMVEKSVTSLSFEGDNAVVTFAEGDQQTVDMGELSITLSYSEQTAIESVAIDTAPTTGKIFNVAGQYVGNVTKTLGKGLYIIDGKKIIVK